MSSLVYWTSDGGGSGGLFGTGQRPVAEALHRWIVNNGRPDLIVYGGDVYQGGTPNDFANFFTQMGSTVAIMCETPGNHDWKDRSGHGPDAVPRGYEAFWSSPGRNSKQPIDTSKRGGARYEHVIDMNGWRLIFLDTGLCDDETWPVGDSNRLQWLKARVSEVAGRSKIVFAHHSRLSYGLHGDRPKVDAIWGSLFDDAGHPLVACAIAGHDHNVSVYQPRGKDNPATNVTTIKDGVQIWVNGAGGEGFYSLKIGTPPDVLHDTNNYCVTKIELVDARNAQISVLSFGSLPTQATVPSVLPNSTISYKF